MSLTSCCCLEYAYLCRSGGIRISFVHIGTFCITVLRCDSPCENFLWESRQLFFILCFRISGIFLWISSHFEWISFPTTLFMTHSSLSYLIKCHVMVRDISSQWPRMLAYTTWCDGISVVMTDIASNVCHNSFHLAILYHCDVCYIAIHFRIYFVSQIMFPGQGACNNQLNHQWWIYPTYRH